MNTKVILVPIPVGNQKIYLPSLLEPAVALLKKDSVVGIPTETVYGLAANALCGSAVKKIFEAKKRPADNPLIVHISNLDMLSSVVDISSISEPVKTLMREFWPGPLTILLKKSLLLPDEVTAGQPTVGVRWPSHPIAQEIISLCGFPLAAPSANSSGRPSPTTAQHVLDDLAGIIPCVVDSGQCQFGIESTVIDCNRSPPVILRPGAVTAEMIMSVFPNVLVYKKDFTDNQLESHPTTPGMKYRHYSPNAKLILFEGERFLREEAISKFIQDKISEGQKIGHFRTHTNFGDWSHFPTESYIQTSFEGPPSQLAIAKEMFKAFRYFDDHKVNVIVVEGIEESHEGLAIMNRLRKAASEIINI